MEDTTTTEQPMTERDKNEREDLNKERQRNFILSLTKSEASITILVGVIGLIAVLMMSSCAQNVWG